MSKNKIAVGPYKFLRIEDGMIRLGKDAIPLAGAHAEIETESSGLFKRNVRTIMTVTSGDGSQLVHVVGAGFGTKGGASRTWEANTRRAAAMINTAAAQGSVTPTS
jgi:hypothetical protein